MRREGGGNLSRELIYAGLTRAWRESHIAASEAVLRLALLRHVRGVGMWRLG